MRVLWAKKNWIKGLHGDVGVGRGGRVGCRVPGALGGTLSGAVGVLLAVRHWFLAGKKEGRKRRKERKK